MAAGKPSRRRLLHLILAIPAVVVLAALVYWELVWHRPMGNGPAGPAVPAEPFGKPWTTRPVLLLGLGDSITAGFGAGEGLGYFERLARNPGDEFADLQGRSLGAVFPNLKVLNLSLSGSTSLQHEKIQLPKIPPQDAATLGWVVITTGGNDLIHNYGRGPIEEGAMYGATWTQAQPWIANFEQRLDRMFVAIDRAFPGGCHIFIANIYDPTDGAGDIQMAGFGLPVWPDGLRILTDYNDVIAHAAAKRANVHVVDIRTPFLGHGLHCRQFWTAHFRRADPHYWYFSNLEDPNDRGYDAIRRLFLLEMLKVAPRLPPAPPTVEP